jgi:small subunit ribosomal protein S6
MIKYEAMFIVKPELSEDEKKTLFGQIADIIVKNNGKVLSADIWSEKRKLWFRMKKYHEGIYYLVNFNLETSAINKIKYAFKLNESILRVMILRVEKK